ncbi:uncharacterized protein N7500_009492 [Penicillium coprophilum]|uniref:uncharacterized protein n=1 Tax=Penicillium coprophilum TaxID=36646 RepID=UPI00238CE070|nr:uncharacterized protein N7500_009492 [Penicillium coprophilum]KAJ5154053.1 hypothetical protein N7500_009492 [Penicillium coprophilum]
MVLIVHLVIFTIILAVILRAYRNKANLPPGPKGKFLIGNLFDLPSAGTQEWQHWLKHKDLYGIVSPIVFEQRLNLAGPISSVTVLGQTLIIVNDRDLAFQILEKNSIKHSSRPHLVFAHDLVIGTRESAAKFNGFLELEARRFAYRVLHAPEKFIDHNRTGEDPLVRLANLAVWRFAEAAVPGAWLVDFIPALKYVPEWMPGANFQRVAKEHLRTITRFAESPVAFTKSQIDRGKDRLCFVSTLLRQGEDEEIVKWSAAAIKTTAILEGFFLVMMLFPDVQRKAQAEMDELFGKPTLPSATDRERLPYVNAIVKEAIRWHTVAPMGIPHKTDEDDIINGAFNNDPTIYPNPREFRPERFLSEPAALEPEDVSFGFGRRICPGRLIAETSIFLTIAHTLAVFEIKKPTENGQEIEPNVYCTPGLLSHFDPFHAILTPRSQQHEQLIVDFEKEFPFEMGDSEVLAEVYH